MEEEEEYWNLIVFPSSLLSSWLARFASIPFCNIQDESLIHSFTMRILCGGRDSDGRYFLLNGLLRTLIPFFLSPHVYNNSVWSAT